MSGKSTQRENGKGTQRENGQVSPTQNRRPRPKGAQQKGDPRALPAQSAGREQAVATSDAPSLARAGGLTTDDSLDEVAYCYDGSTEGLLTAVFLAYANHENPQDVVREGNLQARLGQAVRMVETDLALAERVLAGVRRTCGQGAAAAVVHASLADDPDAGTAVYRFVRYAMKRCQPPACESCVRRGHCPGLSGCTQTVGRQRSVVDEIAHPAVSPVVRLERAVLNERHRMKQFLRFEATEGGVWAAVCNPRANVVPLLMGWFRDRFGEAPFIIYDENHGVAGVCDGSHWNLVRTDGFTMPQRSADESLVQAAWKRFYDSVSVEARYNPELRRQFMPKRLWKNIVEMQERMPDDQLARPRRSTPGGASTAAFPTARGTETGSLSASNPTAFPTARDTGASALKAPSTADPSAATFPYPSASSATATPVRSKAGMKLSEAAPPSCQK